jgi:hypothetical protein
VGATDIDLLWGEIGFTAWRGSSELGNSRTEVLFPLAGLREEELSEENSKGGKVEEEIILIIAGGEGDGVVLPSDEAEYRGGEPMPSPGKEAGKVVLPEVVLGGEGRPGEAVLRVEDASVGLQVEDASVGLQVEDARVGLRVEDACVGLPVEDASVELQVEDASVGLQVEAACVGLPVEAACVGLPVEAACVGLPVEVACVGLPVEDASVGLRVEDACVGLQIEDGSVLLRVEDEAVETLPTEVDLIKRGRVDVVEGETEVVEGEEGAAEGSDGNVARVEPGRGRVVVVTPEFASLTLDGELRPSRLNKGIFIKENIYICFISYLP